ncbi:MAG: flavin reductase family protein [Candidatus Thermoplasmatota archaeon]|jgi:flavin reductase (DIM6/NTAB) family NADH-FMN oxidoreductase RutF|nr:flavin reductase family protein [Candidatus Thermoplasmatota archaeon]
MKINGSIEKYYHYAFPMQTVLVTSNDEKNNTNIITLAWHTPISRNPPLYGISISPKRYSYTLIKKNKEFVINFMPYSEVEAADYCGTHSGKNTDKLCQTGLTLKPSQKLKTPLIKEGYAHLECKLVKTTPIGDHTLFVGEVVAVSAEENAFENHLLRTDLIHPLYYIGQNAYTTLDRVKRKIF